MSWGVRIQPNRKLDEMTNFYLHTLPPPQAVSMYRILLTSKNIVGIICLHIMEFLGTIFHEKRNKVAIFLNCISIVLCHLYICISLGEKEGEESREIKREGGKERLWEEGKGIIS